MNMKKISKLIGNGERLTVEYGLKKYGDQIPYFSITSELRKSRQILAISILENEINKYYPNMRDLFKYNGRDANGVPMYVFDNGWYYYTNGDVKALSNHLLISEDEASKLIEEKVTENHFKYKIEQLMPIWYEEAQRLIEKYQI